jgi:hypothetical protein
MRYSLNTFKISLKYVMVPFRSCRYHAFIDSRSEFEINGSAPQILLARRDRAWRWSILAIVTPSVGIV